MLLDLGTNNCSFHDERVFPSPNAKEKGYVWKAIISYDCVSSGLINDMCSPLEATIREANSIIYLSLKGYSILQHCSCIIKGDIIRTNITIIDYRLSYKDSTYANNTVFVNGKPLLPCLNTSQADQVLYNMPVNVTGYRTNITVSKHDVLLPDTLWISAKGLDVTVQCNTDDNDSTPKANSLTPVRLTGTTSKEGLETTEKLSLSGSSEVFPSSIVAGASVGVVALVAVILTVYLLHRRRSRRMHESSNKVIYYNESQFAVGQPIESRIYGGTNRARENADELYVNMSNSSPEDQESNNVYLNMVHQALNEADAEHTEETIKNIQNKNENRLYDTEEPNYKNLTRGEESESNYCKLNKTDEDTHEYNYLELKT